MEGKTVCVIGAGTMGSGIAAHLANLGFRVHLLDLTEESVRAGLDRAARAKPPHFFLPETAKRIELGTIAEMGERVRESDWVCEAIVEKLDEKRRLFAALEEHLRADAMVSTNTSGLQISLLAEGRSESFRRRFLGTHFFNPPRYLKLLELIPTPETDPDVVAQVTEFLEDDVARRVVVAKDTPGFIANRFGMWAMIHAIHTAEKLGMSIEQVDAITGSFLGRPRSASFRLNDIVGLDIMQDIAQNLFERCPDDPERAVLKTPHSMAVLLDRGWIGDKAGQGYYRREGKDFLALDLKTLAYRDKQDVKFESLDALAKLPLGERVRAALDLRDEAGEFLREHLVPVLRYADTLKAEISHSVQDFDRVMRWGFAWEMGPFEMIDGIGPEKLGIGDGPFFRGPEMKDFSGVWVSKRLEPKFRRLDNYPLVARHEHFETRDLGDGVIALATTTKMGVYSPPAVREISTYLLEEQRPLVLTSIGKHFSAGFDLKFLLETSQAEGWDEILASLKELQDLGELLSRRKACAAVFGYTLGGGYEMAMACPVVAAHVDAMIALPESRVGLIPGGGGTARMRVRHQTHAKSLVHAARTLILGTMSTSADDARRLGWLRSSDVTVYHPDKLMTRARELALTAEPSPMEWRAIEGPVSGMLDQEFADLRSRDEITDHDLRIGHMIKMVFAKDTQWTLALEHERQEFIDLLKEGLTIARIQHMLDTGKPLRN
ncbi:MAG TPA: 3-hydroxyacyl-CoA dehydrogenase/enoyl-CoA hydratase family protein [Fimbriimonadaceae bacterium]|nr:3-hydroxyacyl-CoA dehydrogenase/enoyl-CoA hydratase family protein [Fimbriimonadaceae bacterium]